MAMKIPININEKHNKTPSFRGAPMSPLITLKGKRNQFNIYPLQVVVENP
jgi:hypothetical protein